MRKPPAILHETAQRVRLSLAGDTDAADARVCFEQLAGVQTVRVSPAARSVTLTYDGRSATRRAILEVLPTLARRRVGRSELPRRAGETLPLETSLLAAALTPLLPAAARPAAALTLVAAKAVSAWRRGVDLPAAALDSIALASTALTGHPLTATSSLLLSSIAERRRDALLEETDRLLAHLAPVPAEEYGIVRGGRALRVKLDELVPGDRLTLRTGATVPVDAIVIGGRAELTAEPLSASPTRTVRGGDRIGSGARVLDGVAELRVERTAVRSRAARLRDHVRHALRTRDAPGPLTPDLERLVAVPITAAGLVLALTGDAGRTASILQADPQQGIALANPVAREAALYATARSGALLTGLDSIERLAGATAVAFQDVGVLTERYWYVADVMPHEPGIGMADVERWLGRLAGSGDEGIVARGWPDELVVAWREFGAVLPEAGRTLHIGGAELLRRTWCIGLAEPDRGSLVRRLGIVEDGRLVATVQLRCPLRPGLARSFRELRALGVRRIAVFTEDPTDAPAENLRGLGADAIVSSSRAAQERWLDEMVERGERVALVHTGLRNLLPPGGLSLCPVDAEAGAHGVLLGEPLASLLAARATAAQLRNALRRRFGMSVALNSALMVGAAMQWLPPMATASLKHGFAFLLLQQSARLARVTGAAGAARAAGRAGRRIDAALVD